MVNLRNNSLPLSESRPPLSESLGQQFAMKKYVVREDTDNGKKVKFTIGVHKNRP